MSAFNTNIQGILSGVNHAERKLTFILAIIMVMFINGCNFTGQSSPNNSSMEQLRISPQQVKMLGSGIITYYYIGDETTPKFSIPIKNSNIINKKFAQYHDGILATRLVAKAFLVVDRSGSYQLQASQPEVSLFLDGASVANNTINLDSGKVYELTLDYSPSNKVIDDIKLEWIEPGTFTKRDIPSASLIFAAQGARTPHVQGNDVGNPPCFIGGSPALQDSSCNGIPDAWSLHGYTVNARSPEGMRLEYWDDLLHSPEKGYTRYFSAIYKYSTADDPYSDYQKVTGIGINKAVSLEARNPLVSAIPIINVTLESVSIVKNRTTIEAGNGSRENSTSSGTSKNTVDGYSNNLGASASLEIGLTSISANVTANYNHEWNHSASIMNENQNTSSILDGWSQSIQMNDTDYAVFLPTVRYENIGTAPAYDLYPTFTFMAGHSGQVLSTVEAKSNAMPIFI
ncbi:MAG: hypothetical protein K2X04_09610 [Burkholderiales bacterium]|nr:hypothetical protein [Burkholderiales bacterium]